MFQGNCIYSSGGPSKNYRGMQLYTQLSSKVGKSLKIWDEMVEDIMEIHDKCLAFAILVWYRNRHNGGQGQGHVSVHFK